MSTLDAPWFKNDEAARQHLKRYLGEFDFRYNQRQIGDWERARIVLKGIEGKRLTYRRHTGI